MLKQLKIENFKGWETTGNIRMAPITLFFGSNSSGKSSIGQFLMMLKQTVESPDRKAVFYPGGRNSAVQLGSFQEMVRHRDRNNAIAFSYKWDLDELLNFRDPLSEKDFKVDAIFFEADAGMLSKEQNDLVLNRLKYTLSKGEHEILSIGMERQNKTSKYKMVNKGYDLKRNKGRAWSFGDPVRFYGFPDEVVAYHQNAEFVQSLNLEQENFFKSIFYLGPLRTKTDRLYSWSGITPESVGYSGENTVNAILASKSRKMSLGENKWRKPFEEIIALSLQRMGLIEDFKVKQISRQRQEYEVKLCTKGSKDLVDLPDVGFGISQVLPVLVQCFYAPPGSVIIMEQPEIHLHPSAQAALADVMIDVINSRENGKDRNIQLIIETHSEHFLRRLQRRIAEEDIKEQKVAAYFANTDQTPPRLEPLRIDLYGNISNWPEHFFGDEMGDITGQAKASMNRRIGKSPA